METIYFGFVVFLFVLAIFDLMVGVSNDAVNFLQSAIGAKVAKFKTILTIAAIGIFTGAAMRYWRSRLPFARKWLTVSSILRFSPSRT